MNTIGIGLVGCGRWGQRLVHTLVGLEGCRVVAVHDQDIAMAEGFAATLPATAYATYGELLADPDVDAVLVVTPHSLHEAVCVAAAQAGKHIFCEKPLAITVAACYRMLQAAEQHGVKLMCGQVTRLYPIYKRVAEISTSGRLGRLAAVNIMNLVHIERVGWWSRSATMGALLHSPGVHSIDFLLHICGAAASVYAVESPVRVQTQVEYQDNVFLTLEFQQGLIGALQCSVSCLTPDSQGHLIGTEGSLRFDPLGSWIEVADWHGGRERIAVGPDDSQAREEIGVRDELQSFVAWIRNGIEPIVTAIDGLRAVEIIEAAYRSIATKQPVALPLPELSGFTDELHS